mmetsp:Transcript_32921/g.82701  ORF Transcript_32921/g.82701 Transcript_32921/m.82701 type:complete len:253 (-) Transcript_32921:1290-2048(-)
MLPHSLLLFRLLAIHNAFIRHSREVINWDVLPRFFLDRIYNAHFIVPDAASTLRCELGVVAPLATAGALVIPHLLIHRGHKGHCQTNRHRSANTADAVNVVLGIVRESVVYNVGQLFDVDAARGNICADEEADVALLERRQVVAALLIGAIAMHDAARVCLVQGSLALQRLQKNFQVVCVNLCSYKDHRLVHVAGINDLLQHVCLDEFHHLGLALLPRVAHDDAVSSMHMVSLDGRNSLCVFRVFLWVHQHH